MKIEPILTFYGISARKWLIGIGAFALILFYIVGFTNIKQDLPAKSGVVKKWRMIKKSYLWKSDVTHWAANFTIEGDSTVYWQEYNISDSEFIIFLFRKPIPGEINVQPGDSITFCEDRSKVGRLIKTLIDGSGSVINNKHVVNTMNLTLNGKVIINNTDSAFSSSIPYLLGLIVQSCFGLLIALLIIEWAFSYHDKTKELIRQANDYWLKDKDYKKAEQAYLQILKRAPRDFDALTMYAELLLTMNRDDEANVIYERAYKINKKAAEYITNHYESLSGEDNAKRAKYWRSKIKNRSRLEKKR